VERGGVIAVLRNTAADPPGKKRPTAPSPNFPEVQRERPAPPLELGGEEEKKPRSRLPTRVARRPIRKKKCAGDRPQRKTDSMPLSRKEGSGTWAWCPRRPKRLSKCSEGSRGGGGSPARPVRRPHKWDGLRITRNQHRAPAAVRRGKKAIARPAAEQVLRSQFAAQMDCSAIRGGEKKAGYLQLHEKPAV